MKKAMLMISVLGCLFVSCNLPVDEYVEDAKEAYLEKAEKVATQELINDLAGSTAGTVYAAYVWCQNQKDNYETVKDKIEEIF